MNLPFLSKKEPKKEFFLALLLSPGEVRSILFEKASSGLLILGTYTREFSEHLDVLTGEKLIELSDEVISEAEQKLSDGGNLEKVIFSVPYTWISEAKIIKEHLAKLKSLCEALRLSPVGFIVSVEAVIAYLHKKEGLPVTAILVELSQKHVSLTIVKNGTILNVYTHEIEKDTLSTVEKLLATQEDLEVLPSKIILLNYKHAKKIQQSFLSHTWPKSIQFLHLPQVEVLDTQVEAQAVISGVATQMGFNVLPEMDISSINAQKTPVEILPDGEKNEEKLDSPKEEAEKVREGKDMAEFTGEKAGFFKEVDVLKQRSMEAEEVPPSSNVDNGEEVPPTQEEERRLIPVPPFSKVSFPHVSFGFLSKLAPSPFSRGKSAFMYPILAVLLFIMVLVGYYYFFEKAQVILFLDKKNVNKELQVSFSRDKVTSGADSVVHVKAITTQQSGKEEAPATGKKETGDKAKGEVTILSSLDKETVVEKGTVLTSSNSLKFTLDSDVKIASSSGISDVKSAKGKVTATDIGKQYNLPSGSKFAVADFDSSSVEAKNENAFSGGTKKDITVVSAADMSSLQSKVVKSLSQEAVLEEKAKKPEDSEILSFPLEFSVDQKSFSKKEGEEASKFSFSATITYVLGLYKKSDLIVLAKEVSQKDAPSDYSYSGKDSEISVKDVSQDKSGEVFGKLVFSSVFLPRISVETFSGEILGKSIDKAEQLIQVKGVQDDQILFIRSLPFFPKLLPFNKNNIEIVTKIQ